MTKSQKRRSIPKKLSIEQFQQFVLPHLTARSRGPAPKLPMHSVFNYILQVLYLGCQWKELPIKRDRDGRPEIHYTRIYSAFRKWQADGCFDAIFADSVSTLHHADLLDTAVIHGDGTTTAAKKGGDNIGFSGHKKMKGDKIVVFCDRRCNVISPFVSAPGNRNESPLLRKALPLVTCIADAVGLDLKGTIVSLDGVYDCRINRKSIFNRGMTPNINPNPRGRKIAADSDEAGHAFQSEAGHLYRSEAGHRSDLMSATGGLLPQIWVDDVSVVWIGQDRIDFTATNVAFAGFRR
jgi:transposase